MLLNNLKITFCLFSIVAIFNDKCFAEANSLRIISLAPTITEILVELGHEKLIAGKTKYCITDKSLNIPEVGSYLDPSIEAIVSLKPDLVILMSGGNETLKIKLEKFGVNVIKVSNQSISDINDSILLIAESTNVLSNGKDLINKKNSDLKKAINKCKNTNQRALFIFDEGDFGPRKVFYSASLKSIYSELMSMVGLTNILKSDREYSELTIEGLRELAPEKLFIVTESSDADKNIKTISDLSKIPLNNIIKLPKEPTLFPGPRYPEIAELFACRK